MPRGIKGSGIARKSRKPIDERIADIEKTIEEYKAKIADLNNQRKALLDEKERENRDELLKIISNSGMSAQQIQELIDKANK